jgi:MFS family permease
MGRPGLSGGDNPPVTPGRLRRFVLDVTPLQALPEYRWLWFGQLINNGGREITLLALPFQVYVLTGSALAVGGLAAVRLVAVLLFSLPGGSLADAFDRRRLLLVTQLALAGTSVALGGLALLGSPPVAVLYGVAFVATAVSTIDYPTRRAVIVRLVGPRHLSAALVLDQASHQASMIVGPAIGGILIAVLGLSTAYFVDAVTFTAAMVAAWRLSPLPPAGGATRRGLHSILEGLDYVRRVRVVLATFVVDLEAMIFGLPTALFPILAVSTLHGGAPELGLLTAAPAVGALLGATTTGWIPSVRRQGRAVLAAVAIWGVAITGFGLAVGVLLTSLPLALLFLVVAGAADVISAVFRATILQLATPDRLRGRLSALHTMVVSGGPRLGDVESTLVAAVAGAPLSAFLGGLLCLAALAVVGRVFPELDAYDVTEAMAAEVESLAEAAPG